MNRRKFFALLGLGAAGVVVAPKALASETSPVAKRLLDITNEQSILKMCQINRINEGSQFIKDIHQILHCEDSNCGSNPCDKCKNVLDNEKMIDGIGPIARGIAQRLEYNNPELSKRVGQKISEWFKANG